MTNYNTSVDDSNSVRIVNVATFPLARQHLSNCSFPNDFKTGTAYVTLTHT